MSNAVYDPTTLLGQVRFHAADTDVSIVGEELVDNATFLDAEITYALSISAQNAMVAAAVLLDALAADSARLATLTKYGDIATDAKTLSATLREQANQLRLQAAIPGSVSPFDQVFTIDSPGTACPGTMTGW